MNSGNVDAMRANLKSRMTPAPAKVRTGAQRFGLRPAAPVLLLALLIASLAGNLLALGIASYVIHGRGGLAYLQARFNHRAEVNMDPGFAQRQSLFEALAPRPGSRPIVFLGDSLTFGCEWRELFGNEALILNRGIGGDTSAGVLRRADSVAALKPLAVFLMIGTNDAPALGYRPGDTVENHRAIARKILQISPETRIYEESLLPSRVRRFNQWSDETNAGIRRLADGKSVIYLNLRDAFLENGELSNRFTSDGLHLNGSGYLLWKQQVDPIVKELIGAQLRDASRASAPER